MSSVPRNVVESSGGGDGGGVGGARRRKPHKAGRGYKGNSWDCTILLLVPLENLSLPWTRELVDRTGVAEMDLNI